MKTKDHRAPRHKLKLFLTSLPIETYVIFVIYALTFIVIFFVDLLFHRWNLAINPRSLLMGPMIGGQLLRYASLILWGYGGLLIVRYFMGAGGKEGTSRGVRRAANDPRTFAVARSVTFWFIVSTAFVFGVSALFSVLFRSFDSGAMAGASDMLMGFDMFIFGVYPPLFLNSISISPSLTWFLVNSYAYLPVVLGVLLAYLFCTNMRAFRSLFLAMTISVFLSLPFWIVVPAISPNEMYRRNLLHQNYTPGISIAISTMAMSPYVARAITVVEGMWIDKAGRSFSVSSFPSTHVIWGILILYYAYRMRFILGAVALPLCVANFFGTMLLMEHYAVDAIFGVFIGALAIYCAELLLRFDERYHIDHFGLLTVFESLRIGKK